MSTKTFTGKRWTNAELAAGAILLALAGGIIIRRLWTDKNAHDPGITMLEGNDFHIFDSNADEYKDDHLKKEPE